MLHSLVRFRDFQWENPGLFSLNRNLPRLLELYVTIHACSDTYLNSQDTETQDHEDPSYVPGIEDSTDTEDDEVRCH